ncbi:TPA: sugar ABC transporter ATP-binding protein [Pseudomonas aeruginosa]|nr:sugar ABC transporter ATP-binding protein [Pseudomonas aeruginosa]HCE5960875.1 sugar ABC transporter ATP-binding protein [Pseudomonas aeruginosa]
MLNPSAQSQGASLLHYEEVSKRFGRTLAVNRVDLRVEAGSVLALLGENGAGKSTLIKLLAGVHSLDSGRILFKGQPIESEADRSGIAFIHQDLGLIDSLSAAENIAFSCGFPRRAGLINWAQVRRKARAALALVDGGIDPNVPVGELERTQKSLVAIARALAMDAELLVLDEPTASLPADDAERLFTVLERLRARGVGMIYVSHRLDEIFRVADQVAVMRDGQLVCRKAIADTDPQDLVRQIVGREPDQLYLAAPKCSGPLLLEVRDLQSGPLKGLTFSLHAGEILALAGLRGAGQELIGRALFGLQPIEFGEVLLEGRPLSPDSPAAAMRRGLGLVAGDRCGESLPMPMSVRENLYLNPLASGLGLFSWVAPESERRQAKELVRRFGVRPNETECAVETLSGGNQQKVVMARWLEITRRVLILEEPTAGVDVGAKADIYRLIQHALEQGLAVLLISTDFEEVANIAHRALVFSRAKVVASLDKEKLSVNSLLQYASASDEQPTAPS